MPALHPKIHPDTPALPEPDPQPGAAGAGIDKLTRHRARVAASVARHKARMDELTRLEQAAWKGRGVLGAGFDPYTAEERAAVARIQELRADLEAEVERLHGALARRLRGEIASHPERACLLAALDAGKGHHLILKPY